MSRDHGDYEGCKVEPWVMLITQENALACQKQGGLGNS